MSPIGCVSCDRRLTKVSVTKARRAGWELWTGGARCPNCRAKENGDLQVPQPLPLPPPVVVKCTVCGGFFEAENEYVDGYKPGIHWKRSDTLPLPLCRGWNIATRPLTADELAAVRQLPKETHAEPDRRPDRSAPQEPLQPADPADGRQQGRDAERGREHAGRLRRRRQPDVGSHT